MIWLDAVGPAGVGKQFLNDIENFKLSCILIRFCNLLEIFCLENRSIMNEFSIDNYIDAVNQFNCGIG